jgi:hypothetical protein
MTPDSLDALRDIHLPPAPAFWSVPEWVFAAVALMLLACLWMVRRFMRRRSLRAALRELAALEAAYAREQDATRLARGLSRLLRRYAIARFPQAGAEGLTGAAWLRFLDAHGGKGAFGAGVGMMLAVRPYQADGAFDAAALIALARQWMRANPV